MCFFECPPCIIPSNTWRTCFNINVMKDKWIDYITQITLICLIIILAFAIDKIIKLNDRVEELEKRILNI